MKKVLLAVAGLLVAVVIGLTVYEQMDTTNPPQAEGPKTEVPTTTISDETGYTFMNKKLYFTLNHGKDWLKVPASMDEFFGGEYEVSGNELLDNTYVITQSRLGLLIVKGDGDKQKLVWLESFNQGKSWQEYPVVEDFPGVRFRKIVFLNNEFGYVLASGGRVMGQEGAELLITKDDGHTWRSVPLDEAASVGSLIQEGGFINESTAFICRKQEIVVTQNVGQAWQKAVINVPDKYKAVFLNPEMPYEEAGHLYVALNQGDNGDYQGGTVKGLFESTDGGLSWDFVKEERDGD